MNVIYDNQFGFRKNYSTSHAVNYFVSKLLSEIEKRQHVIGIFIDLSKAFDTIHHQKLLVKLEHYGIRDKCHDLLRSYLTNRTQCTNFQHVISETCSVEYGVPQGSVLGPLLFLICINDIVNSTALGHFVPFADDTNIFVSGKSKKNCYNNAQMVLNEIIKYMNENLLHINIDKSVYMYFRNNLHASERLTCARQRQYGPDSVLKIRNHKIKKVDNVRFLGIIINEKLTWEHHIENLTKKLNLSMIMIKCITKFVPKSGPDSVLKIRNHKIKKVDNVRFLGIIINEKLTWEHHIENLTKKLNLSMIMIKCITKFVPKSEYMKILGLFI